MSLDALAQELEKSASINGVEIFVDNSTKNHNFIPIVNEKGIVGAIGEYLEKGDIKTGFFILNERIVKYALNEGFEKDQLFDCFKDKIFDEVDKIKFFKIMTEKPV